MHDEPHQRTQSAAHARRRDAVRAPVIGQFGPNWFASVMGTGIVANAIMLLGARGGIPRAAAIAFWLLAAVLLVVVTAATAAHWHRDRPAALAHAADPAMAQFYGAPPMALLTVGAGSLLAGRYLIGLHAAVLLDSVLWSAGTLLGLLSSFAVPYLMFTRHRIAQEQTLASWLMPIVPPMVSAATGAGLIAHLPAGQDRMTLLLACYAMFGMSLFVALIVFSLLWARLAYHGLGAAISVPTLWIGLGPLGQSITAVNLLGAAAQQGAGGAIAPALRSMELLYGVPIWGFALLWLALAAAMTLRTARQHLPFSLGWWSFTFPVGTLVTGTAELAVHTGLPVFSVAAFGLFGLLLAGFALAVSGTLAGVLDGSLLSAPARLPQPAGQARSAAEPPSMTPTAEPAVVLGR